MAAWHGEYSVAGGVWTNGPGGARREVRIPESFWLQYDEYPDREPPNAPATLGVMGLRENWDDDAERYPALGLSLDLDLSTRHRLERLWITVPLPGTNCTFGLIFDEPIDWLGDHDTTTAGMSGGWPFGIESHRPGRVWSFAAHGDGRCPWLSDLELRVEHDPTLAPWSRLTCRIASTAPDHPALNGEFHIIRETFETYG